MRNYSAKMNQYRIPKERYKYLRGLCLRTSLEDIEYIRAALALTVNDDLAKWLYRHVTDPNYTWAQMESEGLPCTRDTFRLYRAKFYFYLDSVERGDIVSASPCYAKKG